METVILTIEVTAELDKALQEIATKDLMTKEDVARGIIATTLVKANSKPKFLGFDQSAVITVLQGIASALGAALAASALKKSKD